MPDFPDFGGGGDGGSHRFEFLPLVAEVGTGELGPITGHPRSR